MDFEKLIPIIFLIVWTIIAIAGKKKRRKSSAPDTDKRKKPTTTHSPLGKFQNTLESLFTELAQPPEEELPETLKPKETLISKLTEKEKSISEDAGTEISITNIKPPPITKPAIKSAYSIRKKRTTKKEPSVEKLREAVIWSEILAKPIALRDE